MASFISYFIAVSNVALTSSILVANAGVLKGIAQEVIRDLGFNGGSGLWLSHEKPLDTGLREHGNVQPSGGATGRDLGERK